MAISGLLSFTKLRLRQLLDAVNLPLPFTTVLLPTLRTPSHSTLYITNPLGLMQSSALYPWLAGELMEVGNIINCLTDPPNPFDPASYVVAPSVTGFGFSPAAKSPGLNTAEAGRAFNALMFQLVYLKYILQARDFGAYAIRYMATDFPDNVVSMLSKFWIVLPNAVDLARYAAGITTVDGNINIAGHLNFAYNVSGYRLEQETKPLALAVAMTDWKIRLEKGFPWGNDYVSG